MHDNLVGDPLTENSAHDALTSHSEPNTANNHGDSLTLYSVHDTLTPNRLPVIVGLDWEKDGWRVSYNGAPAVKMSRAALLTEPFEGADLIVVEQAHMKESNVYSVAQVYSQAELESLVCRAKIKLFPGMPGQLAKASRATGNVLSTKDAKHRPLPDKKRDAETLAQWAAVSPGRVASWKPLRVVEEDPSRRLWEARDTFRADMQEALNPLRTAWNGKHVEEKYLLPEVVQFCTLLSEHFDTIPAGAKEQFRIKRTRNGVRVESMPSAITAYLAVFTREGELRRRPDGGFIGVRFILDAIGMSSSYRPNMARSQMTHHGMRHFKGGSENGSRCEYMRNLRQFLAFLRDTAGDPLTWNSAHDALTDHSEPSQSLEAV